jgi:plastocyanin
MPPVRTRLGLLAAALLAAGQAGCVGHRPTTQVRGRTLTLRMEEYRFVPQKIEASAGPLTIRARDDGVLAHNVAVFRKGFEVGGAQTVQHGQTTVVHVNLPRGTYRLKCTVSNHESLGMYASLVVR